MKTSIMSRNKSESLSLSESYQTNNKYFVLFAWMLATRSKPTNKVDYILYSSDEKVQTNKVKKFNKKMRCKGQWIKLLLIKLGYLLANSLCAKVF